MSAEKKPGDIKKHKIEKKFSIKRTLSSLWSKVSFEAPEKTTLFRNVKKDFVVTTDRATGRKRIEFRKITGWEKAQSMMGIGPASDSELDGLLKERYSVMQPVLDFIKDGQLALAANFIRMFVESKPDLAKAMIKKVRLEAKDELENAKDLQGRTLLHHFATTGINNEVAALELAKELKMSFGIKDDGGSTPVDIIQEKRVAVEGSLDAEKKQAIVFMYAAIMAILKNNITT